MTYKEALRALEERQEHRIELGLDRVRTHLEGLGSPHLRVPVLHVAGTNGKGSVCAMLASVLSAAGYRTGLYTSPHLVEVRERIGLDGRPISRAAFAELLKKALAAPEGDRLTYFELLTSVAFQYFARARAEVAVLETGLGGRLDATNVVERPLVCVLTTVDYDHMGFLGDTLSKIAFEKAGILKPGVPCVCSEAKPEPLKVIRDRARQIGADLVLLNGGVRPRQTDWIRGRQNVRLAGARSFEVPLLGTVQPRNVLTAFKALEVLRALGWKVPRAAVSRGFSRVEWPGRFWVKRFRRGGRSLTALLDGAHNPEAMRHFVSTLRSSPWGGRPRVTILGMLRDKDRSGMLRILAPELKGPVLVAALDTPRGQDPGKLAREVSRAAPRACVEAFSTPELALERWAHSKDLPPLAAVCGSLYLVGAAIKWVQYDPDNFDDYQRRRICSNG